jgi:putative hydrolase of HD superfamily
MLLVHDLGEIDAGDKFVFAPDGWEDRKVAERRAVERICNIAPLKVANWLITLWSEFFREDVDHLNLRLRDE